MPPAPKARKETGSAAATETHTGGEPRQPSAKSLTLRRAIMDTAAALFAERGYNGTNLQDIADELGMSRPGLYYHFPSKEKLLQAMAEEITLPTLKVATEVEKRSGHNPVEALRDRIRHNSRWLLSHGQMFRVLDKCEGDLPPDLRKAHNDSKRASLDSLVTLIQRGIDIGQFRPVDATISAFMLLGMCNWTAWWFKPEGRVDIETVVEMIADTAIRALLRPDSYRSRSEKVQDILRILQEDVAHLQRMIES